MAQKKVNIKDVDLTKGREFYSMQEFVNAIRGTLKVITWGAHNWIKIDKYTLRFTVQAHRHTGHIYVVVNGLDYFDIYLTTNRGNIVEIINDIDISSFINVIDEKIERIPKYTH